MVYPFRKRDPLTGRWYRARWKAPLDEIVRLDGVVDGPPEARTHLGATSGFQARPAPQRPAELLEMHPHRAHPPGISDSEEFLVGVFLRRYAACCTRNRRFAQAQGAAALYRELFGT